MKRLGLTGCLIAALASGIHAQGTSPVAAAVVADNAASNGLSSAAAARMPEALRKARQAAQVADDAYAEALAKAAPELADLDGKITKARADLMALLRQRLELVRSAEKTIPEIVAARNIAHENLTRAQVRQPVPALDPPPPVSVPLPLQPAPSRPPAP